MAYSQRHYSDYKFDVIVTIEGDYFIQKWCEENCQDAWRVSLQNYAGNGIMKQMFSFVNDQDAILFALRWSEAVK